MPDSVLESGPIEQIGYIWAPQRPPWEPAETGYMCKLMQGPMLSIVQSWARLPTHIVEFD